VRLKLHSTPKKVNHHHNKRNNIPTKKKETVPMLINSKAAVRLKLHKTGKVRKKINNVFERVWFKMGSCFRS
jgi:hypothetical protein